MNSRTGEKERAKREQRLKTDRHKSWVVWERERGVLKKKEMSIEQLIARGRERMCDIKREDMSDFQITIF